jgi:hypothetical protein
MNKQMLTYIAIALIVLMASDKLKTLPGVNKLPTF